MSELNWGMIQDGGVFESLLHAILHAEDSKVLLFGRPGKDAGQDARSADNAVVYQAKYRKSMTVDMAIKLALAELENIIKYRQSDHPNSPHWQNVSRWVFVGNFQGNSNDKAKWEKIVIPKFEENSLVAECWGLEILGQKIQSVPWIKEAFFDGENRVFIGLKEAYDLLSSDCVVASNLDVPIVGRDESLKKIKEFANSNDKSILPIVGCGGIGKSRLLYESVCDLAESGWRVLWALPATMARSSRWFHHLNNSQKTCLVIDDLEDIDLLRTLVEQVSISGHERWKVLITCRLEHSGIFKQLKTNSEIEDQITLTQLTEGKSKELLKFILGDIFLESRLHSIFSITQGIPSWLCLIAEWLKSNSATNFPATVADIASEYVESFIQKLPDTQQDQGRMLLKYLSLWGDVTLDVNKIDQPQIRFLVKAGIEQSLLQKLLEHFVTIGIVKNWGVGKQRYAVKPPLIRLHLLGQWLFDESDGKCQVNIEGKQIINQIIDDEIPNREMACRSLSQLSESHLEISQQHNFLSPLFEEMMDVVKNENKNIIDQQNQLRFIEEIGSSYPEKALDVLQMIRKTPKPNMAIDSLWGDTTLSHAAVVAELPWVLFCLAKYVIDARVANRYLNEFQDLFEENNQLPLDYSNRGKSVEDLLERLVCGSRNSGVFAKPAREIAQNKLDEDDLSPFIILLLKCFLNPQRTYAENASPREISITQTSIQLGSAEWQAVSALRNKIYERLEKSTDINNRCQLWDILSRSHQGFRSLRGQHIVPDDLKQVYYEVLKEDLEKCCKLLESQNQTMEEATHARSIWKWYLEYSNDAVLKNIAQKCKNLYEKMSSWKPHTFFHFYTDSEANPEIKRVADILRESEDVSKYKEFFNEASQYLEADREDGNDRGDYGQIYFLAKCLADFFNPNDKSFNPLTDFVLDILNPSTNAKNDHLSWDFAIGICKEYLKEIKSKTANPNLPQAIKKLFDIPSNKARFCYSLYINAHPVNLGNLTDAEFEQVLVSKKKFTEFHLADLLGVFAHVKPDAVFSYMEELLTDAAESSNEADSANQQMVHFVKVAYWSTLRYEWKSVKEIIEWIVKAILKFELDGAFLGRRDVGELRKYANYRMSVSELVLFLRSRIDLEKQPLDGASFEVMSDKFNANEWCVLNIDDSDAINSFNNLCEMVLEWGFIASFKIPKYLSQLDASGKYVAEFVSNDLKQNTSITTDRLVRLGYLASAYLNSTDAWKSIAKPICEQASNLTCNDRVDVYYGLSRKGIIMMSSMFGEVAPGYFKAFDSAKSLYDLEPEDSPFKPFRKWEMDYAKADLERAEKQTREDVDAYE